MTSNPSRVQCRGDNLFGQQWIDIWADNQCATTYHDFVYLSGGQGSPVQWNSQNWRAAQSDFILIINKYLGQGNKITIPGAEGYNGDFQNSLATACNSVPGVCDQALQSFCQGKSTTPGCPNCRGSQGCGESCSSREGIASNAGILQFCGCYAPLPDVTQARKVIESNPECDPLCTRQATIHLDDGSGGLRECTNDVCVIDNITIQAAKSSVSGGVNFEQICSNCDPCTCIISGINISQTADQVQDLVVEFNQFCGQNSLCLKIDPSGVDEPVNCAQALKGNGGTDPRPEIRIPWWLVVGVVVLLIVIILIMYPPYI